MSAIQRRIIQQREKTCEEIPLELDDMKDKGPELLMEEIVDTIEELKNNTAAGNDKNDEKY